MVMFRSATGNDGLKWETSEQTNIGIDARFLNSRLTVTMIISIKTQKT